MNGIVRAAGEHCEYESGDARGHAPRGADVHDAASVRLTAGGNREICTGRPASLLARLWHDDERAVGLDLSVDAESVVADGLLDWIDGGVVDPGAVELAVMDEVEH